MNERQRIGERIKTMRLSRGLTQDELAEQCGVTRSAVSFWEHGQRDISWETICALSDIFNVRPSAITEDENPDEDRELWELRESLRRNPDLKVLFSLTKNATQPKVRQAIAIIKALDGNYEE